MNIEEEIIKWNAKFPIDRWWRKKYNVPFNSPTHKEANFLDQLFEYREEELFIKLENKDNYRPNTGDFIKEPHFNSEEEKQAYLSRKSIQDFDSFDDEIEE